MKRNVFRFIILLAGFSLTVFSSCTEEDATTVSLNKDQTASFTCEVEAQLDLLNDTTSTNFETAPEGTKVFIRIQNTEYNPNATGVSVYETQVGADGMVTYEIPVTEMGTNVTISFDEFIYDQKVIEFDGDLNEWVYDDPETKKYTANDLVVNYVAGQTYFEKVQYIAQSF